MCNILHLKQDNVKYMTHYQKKEKLLWDSEGFKGFEENRLDSHGFGKSILSFVNFFENPITWILSTPSTLSSLSTPTGPPLHEGIIICQPGGARQLFVKGPGGARRVSSVKARWVPIKKGGAPVIDRVSPLSLDWVKVGVGYVGYTTYLETNDSFQY